MSQVNDSKILVVKKRRLNEETIERLTQELFSIYKLDKYTAKFALNGYGLAVLARGEQGFLEGIGSLLNSYQMQWAVTPTKPPALNPAVVKDFTLTRDAITMQTRFGELPLIKGSKLLVLLGDMGGRLPGKVMNMTSMGRKGEAPSLPDSEKYNTILNSQPVLDVYILSGNKNSSNFEISSPLRFIPGKFNPKALGKYATMSMTQNLDRVIRLIRSYAGNLQFNLNFGLFHMPRVMYESDGSAKAYKSNMEAFVNYGWYLQLLELNKHEDASTGKIQNSSKAPDSITASSLGIVAESLLETATDSEENSDKIKMGEQSKASGFISLPPPPPVSISHRGNSLNWRLIVSIALPIMFIFSGIIFSAFANNDLGRAFTYYGFKRGLIFLALAIVLFVLSFKLIKLKRYMDNTATSKARSAAMGMVEMEGTAVRAYAMFSPLTNVACVYYRLREYIEIRNRNGRTWHLKSTKESTAAAFYLKDETGQVLVEPHGAEVKAGHKQTIYGNENLLINTGFRGTGGEKYIEEMIPEGAHLYVLGYAMPLRKQSKSIKELQAENLRELKQDKLKMMEYDANNDGRIDEEEWESARTEMESEALKEALSEKSRAKQSDEQIVVRKPEVKGLPFVIAESTEEDLKSYYGIISFLSFAGTLFFSVLGILLLLDLL